MITDIKQEKEELHLCLILDKIVLIQILYIYTKDERIFSDQISIGICGSISNRRLSSDENTKPFEPLRFQQLRNGTIGPFVFVFVFVAVFFFWEL